MLRLSEEDKELYRKACFREASIREMAIAKGDTREAKRSRQRTSQLYHIFLKKNLPEELSVEEKNEYIPAYKLQSVEDRLVIAEVRIAELSKFVDTLKLWSKNDFSN